jgi:hypothetical protein
MKTHAFLILAHKQPQLLARIMKVLEKSNHYFFVHVDAKTNIDDFITSTDGIKNLHFIENRVKVYHRGMSIVDAEMQLLNCAHRQYGGYDYYHLISGQCYPLRTNEQFDEFFENTDESFMCFDRGEFAASMQKHYKYCADEFHFNNTDTLGSRVYEKLRLGKILSLFWHRSKIKGYTGGWQWFDWTNRVAEYVLDYMQKHEEYYKRFNHTGSPDEHIFVTLLSDKIQELKVSPYEPLRYVSWHANHHVETEYRPYDLDERDYQYIIGTATFFCRKVVFPVSEKLLDMIDEQREIAEFDYDTADKNFFE